MKITMESLFERRPRTDIVYDVIVAGGGPAGIGAALGAAMNGARTLILEGRSQFGGTGTAAMWMNYNWLYKDDNQTDRGGVSRVFADAIRAGGKVVAIPGQRGGDVPVAGGNHCIHPEYHKRIIFELFDQYKVDYSLYMPVCGVLKNGIQIMGVTVSAKQGELSYRGKVIIDATGDGDVAWYAGCEMEDLNPVNGWRAPVTVVFALGNVDTEKLHTWLRTSPIKLREREFKSFGDVLAFAYEKGYLVPDWLGFDESTIPGTTSCNNGTSRDLRIDGTKSYDLTIAERLGAEEAVEFVRFCRDYKLPGLEDIYLISSGGYAAVRDTRRLVGEYVFTNKDLMEGTDFPDAIASKYGGRDPVGKEYAFTMIKQGSRYPYRSLLPKTVDGLLVAGRCGSASFLGHYGGKSMGNMLVLGQAAGVAGAICAKLGKQPRKLDYKLVQEALCNMGVSL